MTQKENDPLDERTKRRNLILAIVLVAVISVIIILALTNISPEHAKETNSIISR